MFDNLVVLSFYVIALISAFCAVETIAVLIYEFYSERLQYCNAKVGHILKPSAKKGKIILTMRNYLAKLRFN